MGTRCRPTCEAETNLGRGRRGFSRVLGHVVGFHGWGGGRPGREGRVGGGRTEVFRVDRRDEPDLVSVGPTVGPAQTDSVESRHTSTTLGPGRPHRPSRDTLICHVGSRRRSYAERTGYLSTVKDMDQERTDSWSRPDESRRESIDWGDVFFFPTRNTPGPRPQSV